MVNFEAVKEQISETLSFQFFISNEVHLRIAGEYPSKVRELAVLVVDVTLYFFASRINAGCTGLFCGGLTVAIVCKYLFGEEDEQAEGLKNIKTGFLVTAVAVGNCIILSNPIVALGEGLAYGLAKSPTFNACVVDRITAKYPSLKFT